MMHLRTAVVFIVALVSTTIFGVIISDQTVFADIQSDAKTFCKEKYPTYSRSGNDTDATYAQKTQETTAKRVGCERGYVRGDGNGAICNNLVRDLVVSQRFETSARAACIEGYNGKLAAQNKPPVQDSDPQTGKERLGPIPPDGDVGRLGTDQPTEHTSCGITGFFGEILCGFTLFGAKVADASFDMLRIFLKVKPFSMLNSSGEPTGTYAAWALFRGVANIFIVIAFLMVIYSHLTGAGLSNYNLKRMIPRLVVAALLINLSFYLSSLMVDLSNIVGVTLVDLMRGISDSAINADGTPGRPTNVDPSNSFEQISGSVILVGAATIAAGAAALYASFAVLLPVLTSALVALVTTVLTLMLRQVLIIIFIIVSPLAFASMLLPNTSQFFDKWKSAFTAILMVFPAISLLYGAGYIASIAIQRTAAGNGDIILQIMSLGVMVIPLFMVPAVMKLGGGLLNRFGGITNTPGSALRKKAEDRAAKMNNKSDLKALNFNPSNANKLTRRIRGARAGVRTNRIGRDLKNERIAKNREIAGEAHLRSAIDDDSATLTSKLGFGDKTKGEALQQAMAQSKSSEEMTRARNHVVHAKVKAHAADVEAKAIADRDAGASRDSLLAAAKADLNDENNTVTALEKEAAILQLARSGDMGALLEVIKHSYTMDDEQRQTLVNTIRSSGAGAKALPFLANEESLGNILQGRVNESNFGEMVVAPSLAQDDYSATTYSDMDQDGAAEVANVVEDAIKNNDESLISKEIRELHQQAAYAALTNSDTSTRVAANGKHINRIAQRDLAHEEALLENRLRDMNNRSEDPW